MIETVAKVTSPQGEDALRVLWEPVYVLRLFSFGCLHARIGLNCARTGRRLCSFSPSWLISPPCFVDWTQGCLRWAAIGLHQRVPGRAPVVKTVAITYQLRDKVEIYSCGDPAQQMIGRDKLVVDQPEEAAWAAVLTLHSCYHHH